MTSFVNTNSSIPSCSREMKFVRHAGPAPVDGSGGASAHYYSRWIVAGYSSTGSDLTSGPRSLRYTDYARRHLMYTKMPLGKQVQLS
jgi:hypothetical protein